VLTTSSGSTQSSTDWLTKGFTLDLSLVHAPYRTTESGGVSLPAIELLYSEDGGQVQRRKFLPHERAPWTLAWTPGRNGSFTITMREETESAKSELFREWKGTNCLIDAIRIGRKGNELVWQGATAYTEAKFQYTCSDMPLLERYLTPATAPDPTVIVPSECVIPVKPTTR
jgi:hypothetical protein